MNAGLIACADEADRNLTHIVRTLAFAAQWSRVLLYTFEPCRMKSREQTPGLCGRIRRDTQSYFASCLSATNAVRKGMFDDQHPVALPVIRERVTAIRAAPRTM